MKGKLLLSILITILPLATIPLLSGCAATAHQESTGEYIDDSAITLKVKSSLFADSEVKSLPISVKTFKGRVELSGFVDNAEQKSRAVEITRNINGVQAVIDALVVKKH